jgi:hypothetical protein
MDKEYFLELLYKLVKPEHCRDQNVCIVSLSACPPSGLESMSWLVAVILTRVFFPCVERPVLFSLISVLDSSDCVESLFVLTMSAFGLFFRTNPK